MKPFFTLVILALLASTAFAAPMNWGAAGEATEEASSSLSKGVSSLSLHSEPATSQPRGGPPPRLTIPDRSGSGFANDGTPAPRGRLQGVVKKIVKNNNNKKLERTGRITKGQWDRILEEIQKDKAAGAGEGGSTSR